MIHYCNSFRSCPHHTRIRDSAFLLDDEHRWSRPGIDDEDVVAEWQNQPERIIDLANKARFTMSKPEESTPSPSSPPSRSPEPTAFVDVAAGPRHSLGVTADGRVYSWGNRKSSNNLGQLGRETDRRKVSVPGPVAPFGGTGGGENLASAVSASAVFVSQSAQKDSGHSAVLDREGGLWMAGCDRWQQLGLGSAHGGAAGYTWKGGKLWQDGFVRSESVRAELPPAAPADGHAIRDVALGADHTLVLSSNQRDVYAFGKCGDGQCGFVGKPYVSAPKRSRVLSSSSSTTTTTSSGRTGGELVAAVCAIESCSFAIDDAGRTLRTAGKCNPPHSPPPNTAAVTAALSPSVALATGLEACIARARRRGLVR